MAAFVNPIFDRLPQNGGLAARSDGARVLGRVMPVWYIASVVLGALWALQAWGESQLPSVAAASGLLVVSVVMSITLLVPINSRVARWTQEDLPHDWRRQVARWDRLHYVRVGVIILAFVLFARALTLT